MCKKKDISLIINEMMRLPGVLAYIDDVKIRDGRKKVKAVPACKVSSEIVFDRNTFNFHVFPEGDEECDKLSYEFGELRTRLILAFHEYFKEKSNDGISIFFYKVYNDEKIDSFINKRADAKNKDKTIQFGGLGCATNGNAKTYKYIYKYILIQCEKIYYTINFMRYTCNKDGKVGCTMRAIQFHKGEFVNKGANGLDICYPKTDKHGYCYINNAGNICYNPPVKYPSITESNEEELNEIIGHFLDFIVNSNKIATSKDERKNRFKKDYGINFLKNYK